MFCRAFLAKWRALGCRGVWDPLDGSQDQLGGGLP